MLSGIKKGVFTIPPVKTLNYLLYFQIFIIFILFSIILFENI